MAVPSLRNFTECTSQHTLPFWYWSFVIGYQHCSDISEYLYTNVHLDEKLSRSPFRRNTTSICSPSQSSASGSTIRTLAASNPVPLEAYTSHAAAVAADISAYPALPHNVAEASQSHPSAVVVLR